MGRRVHLLSRDVIHRQDAVITFQATAGAGGMEKPHPDSHTWFRLTRTAIGGPHTPVLASGRRSACCTRVLPSSNRGERQRC
jgi:hypothetical protein